jgi:hypothetical protein
MRNWVLVLLVVVGGVVSSAPAKTKKEAPLSKLFCQARYAYVATADGDVIDPNATPEDRDAAAELEGLLKDWNRYTLVVHRREADLVFVVRTGRAVGVGVGTGGASTDSTVTARIGSGPNGPGEGGPGPGAGGTPNLGTNGQDPGDSAGGAGRGNRGAVAAEAGNPDDMLTIYMGPGDGTPQHAWLWRRSEADGLQAPNMPLFQQIRSAVDAGCQAQAAQGSD